MTLRFWRAGLALALGALCSAHVGSPDTWFEGMAGPYPIRVVVRSPGVVPGLAEIAIRVTGPDVTRVTATPVIWNAGEGGAPPPDEAKPVPGDPQLYSVQLWFMVSSSYSVHVTVEGAQGKGTAIVPVQAVASRRLEMKRPMGIALALFGMMLFAGAVTLIGTSVRESVLPAGEEPDPKRRWKARFAMAAGAIALGLLVVGGRGWWDQVDAEYRRTLYKPFAASASVRAGPEGRILQFRIEDSAWSRRQWTPLIPDHGKLMHLFLVRDSTLNALAHLHPVALDSSSFEARLSPDIQPGRYRAFADIVHESGFAQTLVAGVEIPRSETAAVPRSFTPSDPDDSWWAGTGSPAEVALADGNVMRWIQGSDSSPVVGQDASLRFQVRDRDGKPATLDPYLGMDGHAIVMRRDGGVFVHLHPFGTSTMASALALTLRRPGDSTGAVARRISADSTLARQVMPGMGAPGEVYFPYAFPSAGSYRIWVQVKRGGRVLTGAFDTDVR